MFFKNWETNLDDVFIGWRRNQREGKEEKEKDFTVHKINNGSVQFPLIYKGVFKYHNLIFHLIKKLRRAGFMITITGLSQFSTSLIVLAGKKKGLTND